MFYPRILFQRFASAAALAFSSNVVANAAADLVAKINRRNSTLTGLALLLAGLLLSLVSPAAAESAMQTYVNAMQPGTNWGNTFDADTETTWGAPVTTQAMIQGLADKGYKSLRLPVTWAKHMGAAPDYTIDAAWMDRIQQIVDWALGANLYVMVNMHHDSWEWLSAMGHDHDAVLARYQKGWTQIAARFKDYPNKLMFESINEPGFKDANGIDLDRPTMRTLLDEVNTAFFNIVRTSGGGNATRPLVLPSVYTSADQADIDSLKATMAHLNDPNLIATVHYYGWYPFSVNLGGSPQFDTPSINSVQVAFDTVYNTFVANGIPVITGEWGVLAGDHIERGEFLKYDEYTVQCMRSKEVTHMLWDTGGLYNRSSQTWNDPELAAVLTQGVTGRSTNADSDSLFLRSGTPAADTAINLNLNGNSVVSVQDGTATLTAGSDYTLAGSVLTIKANILAPYASGAFGEKTTLTVNANSGPAWKIYVRYVDTPVQSAVTGTTGVAPAI